ncbi:MAG: adenosylcobinamide-GDP ribazoletransferase [Christensenellales bacterium]
MRYLIIALQFLTRLWSPVKAEVRDNRDLARSMGAFPLVGVIIGGLMFLVYWGAVALGFGFFALLAAVTTQCIITGCLHLDGLSDTCDALLSSRSKERMLEIMKDSRIGVMGCVGLMVDLAMKTFLLAEIASLRAGILFMLFAFSGMMLCGKLTMVCLAGMGKSARAEGLGQSFLSAVHIKIVLFTYCIGGIFFILMFGWHAVFYLALPVLAALALNTYFTRKLGGLTGDTLGAANEIGEILFLFVLFLTNRYLGAGNLFI